MNQTPEPVNLATEPPVSPAQEPSIESAEIPQEFTQEKPARSGRLRSLFSRLRRALPLPRKQRRWVMVIVNPSAGQNAPDLRMFNRLIHSAGMEWEVEVTNAFGDGARLARQAVKGGAAVVAAYGGDGTVMDVAAGLLGSDVPLAILPGGTGNALAKELLIPLDLPAACALMVTKDACVRAVDVGRAGEHYFLLRFGAGLEAEITRTADRAMKDRLGPLAYVTATVQAWSQAAISHYRLELDGRVVEIDGLACMVANAGTLGIPGLNISPGIRLDDGLLDVFIIRRADLAELANLAASVVARPELNTSDLPHYRCRELKLEADPPQYVEADGEELGQTPSEVKLYPGALKVIVPR